MNVSFRDSFISRLIARVKRWVIISSTLTAWFFAPGVDGGTVITNHLPANTAIINIDARADGSGNYNADQSLWYRPFNTAGNLLQYTISPGNYNFRVIDPADALRLFPALTSQQTNQIYTAWTFNSPWTTDYLVFDSAAVTNSALPQLFDGAFSNTNGGAGNWRFYDSAADAYSAAISNNFAGLIRTAASGGRDSTHFSTAYTFSSTETLIFAIADNGVSDNTGGVSVLASPANGPIGPELSIEGIPAGSVRLLWPANDPAFSLQSSPSLSPANWTAVSPLPVVLGTNNVVTNAAFGNPSFYRLFKP